MTTTDSGKASQIAADRRVAVTVPVRRGGILSLAGEADLGPGQRRRGRG